MMKEVGDVKEAAEEINELKNKISEVWLREHYARHVHYT